MPQGTTTTTKKSGMKPETPSADNKILVLIKEQPKKQEKTREKNKK